MIFVARSACLVAVSVLSLVVASSRAYADDPCADASTAANYLAKVLTKSIDPAMLGKGTFRIKRTPAFANTLADGFDISYTVAGKVVAKIPVTHDSRLYWGELGAAEYQTLEITAKAGDLNLKFDSGGSHCCTCIYILSGTTRGFIVGKTR